MTSGRVICLVGQIASGKTTLARYLEQNGFERIVTYTTRPPREGESDGKDYIFLPESDFIERLEEGFFAEHTDYNAEFGHVYYGTSKESLETPGDIHKVIVLNPAGIMALKEARYDIFVVYLDFDQETLMRRALARGDPPVEIARRMKDDLYLFGLLDAGGFVDYRVRDSRMSPPAIAEALKDVIG